MQLTGAEVFLAGTLVSVISTGVGGVAVRLVMSSRYVTKESCNQRHKQECDQQELVDQRHREDIQQIKRSLDISFKMLRSLVTYSDIPREEQQKILNTNANGAK